MFFVAMIAVLISLALGLVRALLGPTMFDRMLAGNTVGTLAVLALALIGFVTGRPDFLDLAILYTLLNLVGTIAVLRYFKLSEPAVPVADPVAAPVTDKE
ncbi:MAG: monovalent cation/H+ antiporter complex subunit F [Proteobacteria bacterium]|nr:monovalent cation/H+ antiporter complex subunit F [Pseudomonadota bacterium]